MNRRSSRLEPRLVRTWKHRFNPNVTNADSLQLDPGTPVPAFAAAPVNPSRPQAAVPATPVDTTMGQDWYFGLGGPDSDLVQQGADDDVLCGFFLARKHEYDTTGLMTCEHAAPEFPGFPEAFSESEESCFMSTWDEGTTRAWLLAHGFESNAQLEAFAISM